jgi:tetratricopeptide (TPR) repeat protein
LVNLGSTLIREGRYAEAGKWAREAIEESARLLGQENNTTAEAVYNLGCIEAHTGRPDAALSHVKHAIEHGLLARQLLAIAADPDLKSLHGDSCFKQLMVLAQARAEKH